MPKPGENRVEVMVRTAENGSEVCWCKCWLTDTMAANMRNEWGLEVEMLQGEKKPYGEHHTLYRFVLTDPFKIQLMETLIGHAHIHNDLRKRLN